VTTARGLVGTLVPGVHRWSSALDAGYVAGVVRRSGRRFAHVAGTQVTTVGDLHSALAAALVFPSYYGRNLDALADCLGDVEDEPVLLWDDWGDLARTEPRVARIVLGLLDRSPVCTLLRGDGPDPVRLTPPAG